MYFGNQRRLANIQSIVIRLQLHIKYIFSLMTNIADRCIVDRYFYQSYKKMEEKRAKSLSFYVVRTISLLLALPINYFFLQHNAKPNLSIFTIFLLITLAYTLLQTSLASYFYCAYVRNKSKIIDISIKFCHSHLINDMKSQQAEQLDNQMCFYERQESIGLEVSSIYYDFQNMEKITEVSEEFKAMREANGCSIISNTLQKTCPCFGFFKVFLMLISVFIFTFGIAVSSMAPLNQLQHSLLEMVLISELVFQPRVYVIALLLLLAPFGMVVLCVYCCCCGGKQAKAKLPERVRATNEAISKCPECSICFMEITLEDEVAILPCSQMHVFHYGCIEGWTKMKPNCPNCRHLLL